MTRILLFDANKIERRELETLKQRQFRKQENYN